MFSKTLRAIPYKDGRRLDLDTLKEPVLTELCASIKKLWTTSSQSAIEFEIQCSVKSSWFSRTKETQINVISYARTVDEKKQCSIPKHYLQKMKDRRFVLQPDLLFSYKWGSMEVEFG